MKRGRCRDREAHKDEQSSKAPVLGVVTTAVVPLSVRVRAQVDGCTPRPLLRYGVCVFAF